MIALDPEDFGTKELSNSKAYRWTLNFKDPDDNYKRQLEVRSRGHFSEIDISGLEIWVLEAFESVGFKILNWNVAGHKIIIQHEVDLTSDRR